MVQFVRFGILNISSLQRKTIDFIAIPINTFACGVLTNFYARF